MRGEEGEELNGSAYGIKVNVDQMWMLTFYFFILTFGGGGGEGLKGRELECQKRKELKRPCQSVDF